MKLREKDEKEFDKLEERYGTKEDLRKRRLFDNVTIETFPEIIDNIEFDKELKIEEDIQKEIEDDIEKSIDNENEKEVC